MRLTMGDAEFLFDKTYQCPVCEAKFTAKTVRYGRVRSNGMDFDLRPRQVQVDSIKYEAIMCPHCGYAAMARYFDTLLPIHKKKIREAISASFKERHEENLKEYSYPVAVEHFKMVLLNNMVKGAKASELAYTCLKIAWLYRGMREELEKEPESEKPDLEQQTENIHQEEQNFLQKALDGFIKARMEEDYPMAGMDEDTADYLTAALAIECDQLDTASHMISEIMGSSTASSRIKDKAYDLKEELARRHKEQEEN